MDNSRGITINYQENIVEYRPKPNKSFIYPKSSSQSSIPYKAVDPKLFPTNSRTEDGRKKEFPLINECIREGDDKQYIIDILKKSSKDCNLIENCLNEMKVGGKFTVINIERRTDGEFSNELESGNEIIFRFKGSEDVESIIGKISSIVFTKYSKFRFDNKGKCYTSKDEDATKIEESICSFNGISNEIQSFTKTAFYELLRKNVTSKHWDAKILEVQAACVIAITMFGDRAFNLLNEEWNTLLLQKIKDVMYQINNKQPDATVDPPVDPPKDEDLSGIKCIPKSKTKKRRCLCFDRYPILWLLLGLFLGVVLGVVGNNFYFGRSSSEASPSINQGIYFNEQSIPSTETVPSSLSILTRATDNPIHRNRLSLGSSSTSNYFLNSVDYLATETSTDSRSTASSDTSKLMDLTSDIPLHHDIIVKISSIYFEWLTQRKNITLTENPCCEPGAKLSDILHMMKRNYKIDFAEIIKFFEFTIKEVKERAGDNYISMLKKVVDGRCESTLQHLCDDQEEPNELKVIFTSLEIKCQENR